MRAVLRVLAPLLGLALAAAGVTLAIEVVAAWTRLDGDHAGVVVPWPLWRATLELTNWADSPVPAVAIGVAVAGLALMLVGMSARRNDIELDAPSPDLTVTTSPHVLARLVGKRVRGAEDVAGASVTASKARIGVAVEGWESAADDELRASVADRVSGLLDELPLHRRPRVFISVQERRGPR